MLFLPFILIVFIMLVNIHSSKIIELYLHPQVFFEKTLKYDENHLVRWVIGSFGVCLCVGLCEGANPKCANVGWLKLFFQMCGRKIFKTLRWFECRQTGQVCVKLQRILNRVFVVRKLVWKSKVWSFWCPSYDCSVVF